MVNAPLRFVLENARGVYHDVLGVLDGHVEILTNETRDLDEESGEKAFAEFFGVHGVLFGRVFDLEAFFD